MIKRLKKIAVLGSAAIFVSAGGCSSSRVHTTARSPVAVQTNATVSSASELERENNETRNDLDAELPSATKTGAMPLEHSLVNAMNDLRRNGQINAARTESVKTEPDQAQKKAAMGAFIDLLIDAVNDRDADAKNGISRALWDIWKAYCAKERTRDDMVYTIGFDGQSSTNMIVRRWLEVYNAYPTED